MVKNNTTLLSAAVLLSLALVVLGLAGALDGVRPDASQERSSGGILELRYPVRCVAFAADGKMLATGGGFNDQAGEIRLWDVITGTQRASLHGVRTVVSALAWTPDAQTLASAGHGGCVSLWDRSTGRERQRLAIPSAVSPSLTLSPDGRILAIGGWAWNASVKLRCLDTNHETHETHEKERTLANGSGPVAFSADGRRLATTGSSGDWATVKLWDPATGQELFALGGHEEPVWCVAFAPDGCTVASASGDRTIKLWDVASGSERATLRGHTNQVDAVAFSPDGKFLASASHDRTVRLWDLTLLKEHSVFQGHTSRVTSVAFSPDGQWLASGSYDKTVRLWPVGNEP